MSEDYVKVKRVYNCVKSPPDHRNFLFLEKQYPTSQVVLPPSVDLRPHCSPIVDQGQLGSCTANAIASGLREFMILKNGHLLARLSRLFLYYEERAAEGTIKEDSGASIADGMKCLFKVGVCKEELDPYIIANFTNPPSAAALAEAKDFKIAKYISVVGLGGIKACLAAGYPVVTGMEVFDQMESDQAAHLGIITVPPAGAQSLGGHAVCTVGYVDTPIGQPGYWKGGGYLIVRNSWGASWGLAGYFKLPYAYVTQGHAFEFWTAR
jgi:C1A family cysteine protease